MAINGLFFDAELVDGEFDREYSSSDFSKYLNQLVGNGVFPVPSTQLQVRASTGMQTIVAAGEGWIDGHKLINTADLILTHDPADALLGRIDRVIFFCDYTSREMGIEVKKGTNALTPVAPELTRNLTRYEMCLAEIPIPKQTTSITQSMITDTRPNSTICGWVAALIDQIDTSTMFVQWQTAYSDYYDQIKQQLDDFMETLTEELRVNTYVRQFEKTVEVGSTIPYIYLDMEGYTYEETDIVNVYFNGILAVPGIDYIFANTSTSARLKPNFTYHGMNNEVHIVVTKAIIGIESI